MSTTGLFGKLPSHGDFLCRDLSPTFTEVWDTWLQGFVGGSQEQLGEKWLDTYLTSPIWRFALSTGVIDENIWAGIVLPSVDRVGRYFPFSIARKLDSNLTPTEFISNATEWYEGLEGIALLALQGEILVDDVVDEINILPLKVPYLYRTNVFGGASAGSMMNMGSDNQRVNSLYPYFLDVFLKQTHTSYSAWSTRGSELVEPCVLFSKALPQISGITAMLDGNWTESGWDEPFISITEAVEAQPQSETPDYE